jgi:hypothetical protein
VLVFELFIVIAIAAVPVGFVLALLDILARARRTKSIALTYSFQLILSVVAVGVMVNYFGNESNFESGIALRGLGKLLIIAEAIAQFLLLVLLIPILARSIRTTKSLIRLESNQEHLRH